jgi:hypothetical protein
MFSHTVLLSQVARVTDELHSPCGFVPGNWVPTGDPPENGGYDRKTARYCWSTGANFPRDPQFLNQQSMMGNKKAPGTFHAHPPIMWGIAHPVTS